MGRQPFHMWKFFYVQLGHIKNLDAYSIKLGFHQAFN